MVHYFCLVFLLCVWFPLNTVCNEEKTTEEENTVPLLKDFKVKLCPGLINITWNCNISKSIAEYTYKVVLQKQYRETLKVTMCSFVHKAYKNMEFILHKGLSVQLFVFNGNTSVNRGKETIYMPEGKNNSAAANFTCVIYHVFIMNCSWTVGKEAPEDTQYSLSLRQRNVYVKCQDYRNDSFGRQVGCVMKHPNITFKSKVYVEVLGISNQASVQFFDKLYQPINNVILDPPRNITLTYNSDELEIKWQKPETYDVHQESCFLYNINIKEKGGIDVNIQDNIYKTTTFQPNESATVTMRAKWINDCSTYDEWSEWSEPHRTGYNSRQLTAYHIVIVLGVGTVIILIALIFLCYRFSFWKKLFPQVPKPSMKVFEQVEQREKSVQKESEIEIPFMKKDEDFICSYVTEMPEKL
ncbi:granulocyte-macrophage colony-stimulating factor receptor subunit alpha-like [Rhinoderma darwinii]|uniref:granulocyte-macrophage colony-stimulating factor receptor subunit alpha-like n=1 Tax=Rhinoderma darwinii TaxID=43563 RepID=UPI003F67743C